MASLQPNLEKAIGNQKQSLQSNNFGIENRLIKDVWRKSFLEFNRIIGLPRKDEEDAMNVEHPIYDYEIDLVKAIRDNQHVWILKSRGLGITEMILRYFSWLCLTTDHFENKFFHIVTGTKYSFAAKLLTRLSSILKRNYPDVIFPQKGTEILLNKTLIEAYPTQALKDLRGHVDVSYMFVDEADFFHKTEQDELPFVIKSYEEKSNAKIIMVSTPNRPDGLFHAIKSGEQFRGFFKKLELNYEVGLDKIYSRKFIEREKLEPEFEREYNLKFLGKIGNVFSISQIERCIALGEQWKHLRLNQNCLHFGGVDYGFSSSKTALYIGELDPEHNFIRIFEWQEWDKTTPSYLADIMFDYHTRIRNLYWFVDGSNRGAVNEAKFKFNESLNWETKDSFDDNVRIRPVPFNPEHIPMLKHMYMLVSREQLAIPKACEQLIVSMRTATATNFDLNKDDTVSNDHLDAVQLLLKGETSLDDTRK